MTTSLLFNDPEYKQLARRLEYNGCDPTYLTMHQLINFAEQYNMYALVAKCYSILANDTSDKKYVGNYLYRVGEALLKLPDDEEIDDLAVDFLKLAVLEYNNSGAMYCLAAYFENYDYEISELFYKLCCAETKDTPDYPQVALRYSAMLLLKLKRNIHALNILCDVIDYYEQDKEINIIDEEFNKTTPITDVFYFYGSILLYTCDDIKGIEYLKTGYDTYGNENCKEMLHHHYISEEPDRKQAIKYRPLVHISGDYDSDEGDKKRPRV